MSTRPSGSQRMPRPTALIAVLVLVGAWLPNAAAGAIAPTTHVVDEDGQGTAVDCDGVAGAFTTIQAAIDAASAGDTVFVCPGTYDERLDIDKQLTVTGSGVGVSIVQPTFVPPAGGHGEKADVDVDNLAGGTVIEGFSFDFDGPANDRGGWGILISDLGGPAVANVTISGNDIQMGVGAGGNGAGQGLGITTGRNADVSGLIITGNAFHGDPTDTGTGADHGAEGIYINPNGGTGTVTITDNTFDGHLFAGISVESDNVTVTGNTVSETVAPRTASAQGIRVNDFAGSQTWTSITISDNSVTGFENGLRLGSSSDGGSAISIEAHGNTLTSNSRGIWVRHDAQVDGEENFFSGNTSGAEVLDGSDGTLDAGESWWGSASGPSGSGPGTGDSVDVEVDHTPYLRSGTDAVPGGGFDPSFASLGVSSGGAQTGATGRIQEALAEVDAGGTVFVSPGVYPQTTTPGITIDREVTVTSGGAGGAVVSGDTKNGSVVNGADPLFWVTADGVTIENLTIDLGNDTTDYDVGVMTPNDGSVDDLTIQDSIFRYAHIGTGPADGEQLVHIGGGSGSQVLRNDLETASSNSVLYLGEGTTTGLVFSHNTIGPVLDGDGGGTAVNSFGPVTDSEFSYNTFNMTGIGVYLGSGSVATDNVLISHNTFAGTTSNLYGSLVITSEVPGVAIGNVDVTFNTFNTSAGPAVRIFDWSPGTPDIDGSTVAVNRNVIAGNAQGLVVEPPGVIGTVDATCNWWGSISGPGGAGPGTGDTVTGGATYQPFLWSGNLPSGLCANTGTGIGGGGGGGGGAGAAVTTGTIPAGGGTVSTDPAGTGASAGDPLQASVTSPNPGTVTITKTTMPGIEGYTLGGSSVTIEAPDASSPDDPLVLTFAIDRSQLPIGTNPATIVVFRNGIPVPGCTGTAGSAEPDPCATPGLLDANGDFSITVYTTRASWWGLGIAVAPADACATLVPTIVGTESDDILVGTPGPDIIFGLGGDDIIRGLFGDDIICGGDGDDSLFGGPGDDQLYGGTGRDLLRGHEGVDTLVGGDGLDRLQGWADTDSLFGGSGDDRIFGGSGADLASGQGGRDKVNGGLDDDTLYGGSERDWLFGRPGVDTLFGDDGPDRLYGGAGDDILDGGGGADTCTVETSSTSCEMGF